LNYGELLYDGSNIYRNTYGSLFQKGGTAIAMHETICRL